MAQVLIVWLFFSGPLVLFGRILGTNVGFEYIVVRVVPVVSERYLSNFIFLIFWHFPIRLYHIIMAPTACRSLLVHVSPQCRPGPKRKGRLARV